MANLPIILSVSFANDTVVYESYSSLVKRMVDLPCEVWVWDNHYPLGSKGFVKDLCSQYAFRYMSLGENVGMYKAYNTMISEAKSEVVILHDGDHYIQHDNWHLILAQVMQESDVAVCTVNNKIISRELSERGFDAERINGVNVLKPHQVVVCTCAAWRKKFLDSVGGLTGGHKYYGGNEVRMWEHFDVRNKYYVLEEIFDDKDFIEDLADWEYTQYKLLYAHRGLDMSFKDYVHTHPSPIDINALLKQIFG